MFPIISDFFEILDNAAIPEGVSRHCLGQTHLKLHVHVYTHLRAERPKTRPPNGTFPLYGVTPPPPPPRILSKIFGDMKLLHVCHKEKK